MGHWPSLFSCQPPTSPPKHPTLIPKPLHAPKSQPNWQAFTLDLAGCPIHAGFPRLPSDPL